MRSSILLCLVPVVLCAAASPSPANVTISNAATANMTCSGGVCAPTATDAVLNVQDLEAMLASGNAKVTTTGSGVQAKNIRIDAPFRWSAATTLALYAFQSIELNRRVTVAGGGVSLTTNDGGISGEFACNDKGRLEFSSLSGALAINGTPYTLVNSVASLANAIAANPSGALAFANNYNAKKDGTYTSAPIATVFTGSFDGLGNAISNLSIKDPNGDEYVGLFGETNGGSIANIRLLNENVQATSASSVGGLVGWAGGTVDHAFGTGTVSGGGYVGGLLGVSGANITGSGSVATVSGLDAGGLVGMGGWGAISDSWATGNVSGSLDTGGLVGLTANHLDIKHSWASGQVSTTSTYASAGGLVGDIASTGGSSIEHSYATGAVTCQQGDCGGLVGAAQDGGSLVKISQSWATGSVTGGGPAGGLVGGDEDCGVHCEIADSYATGAVSGQLAGGLVGYNATGGYWGPYTILNSYATGTVNGTSLAGGAIGYAFDESTQKHGYWDMTTSAITNRSQGAGNIANDIGLKGLTDKKLKSGLPKGFDPTIWKEDSNINGGLPYLINNPPPN